MIGDALNEAARLAGLARTFEQRALCSDAAIVRADELPVFNFGVSVGPVLPADIGAENR